MGLPPDVTQEDDDFDAEALLLLIPLAAAAWRRYAPRKYRNTPDEVALIMVLNGLKEEARQIGGLLLGKKIELAEWRRRMQDLVDIVFILSVAAAAGTWAISTLNLDMASEEWRKQRQFLAGFETDITTGKQKRNGNLLVRVGMYALAGWGILQSIGRMLASLGEKTEERRVLGAADHCSDCIRWAALGWQPIGTLPPIGASICRANCHCHFEYR